MICKQTAATYKTARLCALYSSTCLQRLQNFNLVGSAVFHDVGEHLVGMPCNPSLQRPG